MRYAKLHKLGLLLSLCGPILVGQAALNAQATNFPKIDETNRLTLSGATPPLPVAAVDHGPAATATPIRRIHLTLARSGAQEEKLRQLLDAQQSASSPSYHRFLSPAEFGAQFGPADADLASLTAWLGARGFQSIHVNSGRTIVEFSGTAAAVESAFHTAIHSVSLNGHSFYANRADPQIPAALAPIVGAVVSLNNLPRSADPTPTGTFRRDNKTGAVTRLQPAKANTASASPGYTLPSNNTVYYAVTPYDFAALYDVLPLWNAPTPIDGAGQTIAIAGDTDINPADFVSFRTLFGLPLGNTSSQTGTQYLNIIYNGPQPAVRADEFHADSDTQWASAAAKGATIDYVASESTEASSGLDLSAAYIVDNNLAPILVYSYSACELSLGTAGNAFYNALWQQAAAQGITVVTPSGDSGAAGCDAFHVGPATLGKAVSGISSTAYDISVGGTEFNAPAGLTPYFSSSNNSNFASVNGYIPEEVWNDTCTNPAIDSASPYAGLNSEHVCNSASASATSLVVTAGSGGGASNCTQSDGLHPATCTGAYPKPVWQSAPGVLADGVRDTPDVALFASQGRTNSFYVVCRQDRDPDGLPCNLNAPYSDFAAYGGTSLAAPAFAGIMALAAQKNGARIGNPNYVLYKLGSLQAQQNALNNTSCSSGGTIAPTCVFHDIPTGTNAMPCVAGSLNCVTNTPGDAYGVLSAPSASVGYDMATGLGSVDAARLVNSWASVSFNTTSAILSISPPQVVHGFPVAASVTVTNGTSTPPTGSVSLNSTAGNGSVGSGTLSAGALAGSFRNFPGGSYGVIAHYAGDALNAPTDSNYVNLTVTPEPSSTTLRPLDFNPATQVATPVTTAPYGDIYYIRANVTGASGQGIATGDVDILDNGSILGAGVYRLNSSGYTEVQNNAFTPGTHIFSASYTGDSSFNTSNAPAATLTITRAPTTAVLTASLASVSTGSVVTLSAVISTTSYGYAAPSGTFTFYSGSTVLGVSNAIGGSDSATYYRNATATLTIAASPLTLGTDALTVAYSGDTNYLPVASAPAALSVTGTALAATAVAVAANPQSVLTTGTILFSANVSSSSAVSSGTVQFIVDGQNYSAPVAVSGGLAYLSVSVAALPVLPLIDTHTLLAVYSGDTKTFRSSTSPQASFAVQGPGLIPIPAFKAIPTAAIQGTFIAVTATVTPAVAGGPPPTGTVQLVLDGGPYGSALPLSNAAALLPFVTGSVQVGSHVLTILYSGDANFSPAYALPATIFIAAPGVTVSTVTLSNFASQISSGTAAVFTATVAPGNPVPTGIFQIILDGGNPGSPILLNGAANTLTIPASSLPLGNHTVAVFYSGDATYHFSTSPTASVSVVNTPVNVGGFTISPVTTSLSADIFALSKTLLYTVTPSGGFTGAVNFSCSGLPANTACSFSPVPTVITGPASATTTFTLLLDTGVHARNEPPSLFPHSRIRGIAFAALLCLLIPRGLRRRVPVLLSLMLLAVGLATLSGCGSGVASGLSPAGNYTVKVIATGGTTTQTAIINLTITSVF